MHGGHRRLLYSLIPVIALSALPVFPGTACSADTGYLKETYDLDIDAMSDIEMLDTLSILGGETTVDILEHMSEEQKNRYLRISEPEPAPRLTGMIPYYLTGDGSIRSGEDVDISIGDINDGALTRLMFLLSYDDGSSGYIYADGPGVAWSGNENGKAVFRYSDGKDTAVWSPCRQAETPGR